MIERDDASSPPLTRAGLRYARMTGMNGHRHADQYVAMDSSLVHTPPKAPFRSKDVSQVLAPQPSGGRFPVFGKKTSR